MYQAEVKYLPKLGNTSKTLPHPLTPMNVVCDYVEDDASQKGLTEVFGPCRRMKLKVKLKRPVKK